MRASFMFLIIITLFITDTYVMADDFWDLPPNKATENTQKTDDDLWELDSIKAQPRRNDDTDFWGATGSSSLDSYLNEREEKRQIILAEERRKQAEHARLEAARAAEERRQAQILAQKKKQTRLEEQRRQAAQKNRNNNLFGKVLAIGMGAAIADSSSLDSAEKSDFLTNYATDVMQNDMSMNNTQQWKNNTIQSQSASQSSSGLSEADRNKQISLRCRQQSNSYNDGDGQTTSQCQLAIYNQCVADELCSLYPDKCGSLRSRVQTSCEILSKMGDNLCPTCR